MRPSTQGAAARAAIMVSIASMLVSTAAVADTNPRDVAAAEALFRAGRDLVGAGRYDEGCPKFHASFALYPSPGTLLNIAKCHEHDNKLGAAREAYTRALDLIREVKDAARQKTLDETARQAIAALDQRMPKLRIAVSSAPPGLKVIRDGQESPAAALGAPMALEPGPHEVIVSAPGHRTETRSVSLEEGKSTNLEISLTPDLPPAPARTWLRPTGATFAAIGAAGLAVGAATGIVSLNKVSAVKASCGGTRCIGPNQAAQDDVSAATTLGNVSTAGFIAGGVLAAAGIVLLALPAGGPPKSATVGASFGLGSIEVHGRF
ncbi:Hypothetical protein A7982_01307 [Minicystis rosea]|nr:Hypothetical protein A7982_01307 [Minicystis rosea]